MTDDFYSVAIPEQRQILGLKLRPLSLGHVIILHRIESAFLCEGIPDYQELAMPASNPVLSSPSLAMSDRMAISFAPG